MWVQVPTAGFNSSSYWRDCIIYHCVASVTAPLYLLKSTGDALLCSVTTTQQQHKKPLPYSFTIQEFYYKVLAQTKILCQYTLGSKLLLETLIPNSCVFCLTSNLVFLLSFITFQSHHSQVRPSYSSSRCTYGTAPLLKGIQTISVIHQKIWDFPRHTTDQWLS